MKREIIFRGKRIDNGEWVEGYFFVTTFSTVKYMALNPCIQVIRKGVYYCSYEVIPETVGQFTGLMDKIGVRIFEGDILKVRLTCNVKVEYSEKYAEFMFVDRDDMRWGHEEPCYRQVIGNIHDNPELLK